MCSRYRGAGRDRPEDCVPAFGAGAGGRWPGGVPGSVRAGLTSARDSALTWLGWERLTSVIPRPLLCLLTGLVQLLMVSTPRPFLFFGWIVALVTTLVVVCTFSTTAPLGAKISTAAIGLAIGAMIGTLVGGAAARSTVNATGRAGIG